MKRIDIEHLVRWAYRDELPKVAARPQPIVPAGLKSYGSVLAKLNELNTLVQETDIANRYGVLPLLDKSPDDPHPDALTIADAVEALERLDVELPADWSPLSDMGDLGPEGSDAVLRGLDRLAPMDAAGARKARQPLSRLVIRQAVLGVAPSWEAEAPTRRMVTGGNGKPRWFRKMSLVTRGAFGDVTETVEVDGYNPARQRPYAGAYRKFELDPDPVAVVVERGEYELWVSALTVLADMLAGTLTAYVPLPPARPARPWEGGVSQVRIWSPNGSANKNSNAA